MEKKIAENAYFIEDIESFCASIQTSNPITENQTFTTDQAEPDISDSVIKEAENR